MGFEKSFENSAALYDAALEEFIKQGYEQASINKILQTAGMSKGQFYYHFKSKEGLYMALIEIAVAKKQAAMAGLLQAEDLQQDIFTIFRLLTRYGLEFSQANPQLNQFGQSFLRERGNRIYAKVLDRFNFDNDAGLTALIDRAYQNGEFRHDIPLPIVRKTISYLFAHAADFTDLDNPATMEENLNHLITFIKSGLEKKG